MFFVWSICKFSYENFKRPYRKGTPANEDGIKGQDTLTAAQKYSPKEGATFASYAVLRIRGAIVDHLRKSSNLCRTTIQMQQKQKKAVESLVSSLQREPTTLEIAEKMGLPLDEYRDWEKAFNANVHQSLDEVYDEYSMWFVSKERTP